jgi:hypothetical protein
MALTAAPQETLTPTLLSNPHPRPLSHCDERGAFWFSLKRRNAQGQCGLEGWAVNFLNFLNFRGTRKSRKLAYDPSSAL